MIIQSRVEATVENPLPMSIPGQFVLVHSYLSLSAYFLLFSSSFAESPSKHFWASTWKEIVCLS